MTFYSKMEVYSSVIARCTAKLNLKILPSGPEEHLLSSTFRYLSTPQTLDVAASQVVSVFQVNLIKHQTNGAVILISQVLLLR
jgi:hypothetical protein